MINRIVALFLFLIFTNLVIAQTVKVHDINYQLMPNAKAIVIEGNYKGHINIPEKISYQNKTYTVEEIGYAAFNESAGLLSIKLPNTIHTIRQRAFGECKSLKEIRIPVSVTRIDGAVFSNCIGLKSIHIPENVASIGQYAFSRCESLQAIEVDKNNKHFSSSDGILYDKEMKTLIKIPDTRTSYEFPISVTSFATESFEGNKHLRSVNLSDAIKRIPNHAFANCSSLKTFKIPSNVESIGLFAFNGCSEVESFVVDNSNQYYSSADGILYNYDKTTLIKCPAVKTKVNVQESVTKIEAFSFLGCKKMEEVTLPENVSEIGMSAFAQCDALTAVKFLSKKHVNIADGIFPGRTKAVTVFVRKELIPGYKASNSLAVKELNYQALK